MQTTLKSFYVMLVLGTFLLLVISACSGQNSSHHEDEKEETTVGTTEGIETESELPTLVFVNNREANTVHIIDATTHNIVKTFHVGEKPTYTQVTPDGDMLMWLTVARRMFLLLILNQVKL